MTAKDTRADCSSDRTARRRRSCAERTWGRLPSPEARVSGACLMPPSHLGSVVEACGLFLTRHGGRQVVQVVDCDTQVPQEQLGHVMAESVPDDHPEDGKVR